MSYYLQHFIIWFTNIVYIGNVLKIIFKTFNLYKKWELHFQIVNNNEIRLNFKLNLKVDGCDIFAFDMKLNKRH